MRLNSSGGVFGQFEIVNILASSDSVRRFSRQIDYFTLTPFVGPLLLRIGFAFETQSHSSFKQIFSPSQLASSLKRPFSPSSSTEVLPAMTSPSSSACPHLHDLKAPRPDQIVHREECTQCFDNQVRHTTSLDDVFVGKG
jgi:hypothetical protein